MKIANMVPSQGERQIKTPAKAKKTRVGFFSIIRVRVFKVSLNPSVLSRFLLIVKKKRRRGSVFN